VYGGGLLNVFHVIRNPDNHGLPIGAVESGSRELAVEGHDPFPDSVRRGADVGHAQVVDAVLIRFCVHNYERIRGPLLVKT